MIAFGLFWFPLLEALQTNNMTLTLTAAVETSLFSAKIFQRLLIHILTYPSDDVFHLLHPKKKRVQGSCTQEIAHINSGLQHTRKSLRALGGVDGSLSLSRWMLSFTLLSPLHVNSDAESFKDRNVSNVDKLEGNKQTALWEDVLPSVWDDKRTSLKSTAAEFKLLLKMRNRSRFTEQILCSHPTYCKGELN